jgi:energy-coupling factor transporter ATP-binding protein EcfA2
MSSIRIKNFGPIKEGFNGVDINGKPTEFMEIKKVTVFIGNQGSGKSTVAKLISTFSWIEKALIRGDYDIKYFTSYNRFKKNYAPYHRIENYFNDQKGNDTASIVYDGDCYFMYYAKGKLTIEPKANNTYPLPQIMYVPAERNFIANVKTPKALKLTSDSLLEFVTEFDNAKNEMKGAMKLPINDVDVEYNKLNDIIYIKGSDYKIRLTESSSGFQSLVPLYLVSWFLSNSVKKQI